MPARKWIAAVIILLILPVLTHAQAPAPEAPPAAGSTPAATTPAAAPAQTPPPTPAIDSTAQANYVMADTILKLRARPRIAARIEQTVDMLNQRFELKGFYYKDTNNRIRLQLDLAGTGESQSTMLQICDGKVLWEYQKVLGMKNYRKRDIVLIMKKLEDPALDPEFRTQVMASLGFGGPEALLSGFQQSVTFNTSSLEVVDGVQTFILGGQWTKRDGLFGPTDRPPPPTAPLPSYIPSNIRVFIDVHQGWPYRIDMIGEASSILKQDLREIDPNTHRPIGKPRPQPDVRPSDITLRYTLLPESEIKPDEQFVFNAPRDAANLNDETQMFLDALDQAIRVKSEEKKAKELAAEAAGESPIKVPVMDLPATPPAETPPAIPPSTPR